MKIISILFLLGSLVSCELFGPDEDKADDIALKLAHGFWEADSGYLYINTENFLSTSWYAIHIYSIDSTGVDSAVTVVWASPSCARYPASIEGESMTVSFYGWLFEFTLLDSTHIKATFSTSTEQYVKFLTKIRDSADVVCF